MVGPADRRQLAQWMVKAKAFSQRRACRLAGLSRRSYDRPSKRQPDQALEQAIELVVRQHPGWGFWKIHHRLRRLGQAINHKRLWRVYRQMGLNLPRRKRKRWPARLRQPLTQPTAANQMWSLDFMSDALRDGRRFRTLNVLDDYNRQALGVEVDYSLPALRVIRLLQRLVDAYDKPAKLRCDNGPEFISAVLSEWCEQQGIELCWMPPGKPTQNAYIERFNGSFRREVLNAYSFTNLAQVRAVVAEWMDTYNIKRPHQGLGYLTPMEFKQAA